MNILNVDDMVARVENGLPRAEFKKKKILLVVPDHTRTAPVGAMFKALHRHLAPVAARMDVIVALGTHPPMSQEAIGHRLDLTPEEKTRVYPDVRLFNHAWNDAAALKTVGVLSAAEIGELSGGLFAMEVPVQVNRLVEEYDELIIVGPVFPHEVVGYSGGNKYLFPGIAGPDILNFFHWLGAVITNPMIIGTKWTPVRKVVDRAAALVKTRKWCCAMVVEGAALAGLFVDTPEKAWDQASDLAAQLHVVRKAKPFRSVLSCAPLMYDELWVAGKCMYKLEPVVADGGELIIYAPHLKDVSVTHGRLIEELGYHCRDYFLKQWDRFKHYPWGVLAHSTHVRGIGVFEHGVEKCRIQVTLATQIPESVCRKINLGWRDPASIRMEDWRDREDEGLLLVPKAGEQLFKLEQPPEWAGG